MPRRFFRKLLPDPATFKSGRLVHFLGDHIHDPNLWHLNKKSVSRAVFIGIFCAFIPIPMQMFLAAILAILYTANLPLSTIVVWISNPLTFAPLYYACYRAGLVLIGGSEVPFEIGLSMDWFKNDLPNVWKPLLAGSIVLGLIFASLGYWATQIFWRSMVLKRWNERSKKRLKQK